MLSGIPTRLVSRGGFSETLDQPGGRVWAERWWDAAMDRTPDPDA